MMRVANHGGKCCGIKHIEGFSYRPYSPVAALPVRPVNQGAEAEMMAGADFYPGPRPSEPAEVRLQVLLDYIDEKKRDHLIEIVLQASAAANWKEVLRKHHFKLVTKFKNGNTESHLCVFHRVIVNGKPKKVSFRKKKEEVIWNF